MSTYAAIGTFDFVAGALATVGLLYLLYSGTVVVQYRRFFLLIVGGLLVYAVTGPVVGTVAPALIHATHGLASLFIAIGLYDLVRDDIVAENDFEAILLTPVDPTPVDVTPAPEPKEHP